VNLFENPLVIAKHEAERRARDEFQFKFGAFWKCPECGNFLSSFSQRNYPGERCYRTVGDKELCGGISLKTVGYARPPWWP